ncbi:hypothetical protein CONCODRAFT_78486, partial [Conidiobolus coronatus NRRL 28638]
MDSTNKTTVDSMSTTTDTSSTVSHTGTPATAPPTKHNRPCDQCRIKRVFCDKNVNGCRPCERKRFVCTYKLEHRKRGPKSKLDATLDGALKACGLGTDMDSIFKTISIMPQQKKTDLHQINPHPLSTAGSYYANPRSNIPTDYPAYLNEHINAAQAYHPYSVSQPGYHPLPVSYDQLPNPRIESNPVPGVHNPPHQSISNQFYIPAQYASPHKLNVTQAPYSYPIYNSTYGQSSHHLATDISQNSFLANQVAEQHSSVSAPSTIGMVYPYVHNTAPAPVLNYAQKTLAPHLQPVSAPDHSLFGDNFSQTYPPYKISDQVSASHPLLQPPEPIQSSPIYHNNSSYPIVESSFNSSGDQRTNSQQFPYTFNYEHKSSPSNQ